MNTIGSRLREERERLNINQAEFGELGSVKRGAQVYYEKGERHPDAGYLAGIARAGADILYIVTGTRAAGIAEPHQDYRTSSESQLDFALLEEVIRRVEERIAKPGLKFTEYSAEDKAKVIIALYKSFSETGLAPRQHDPAVLSVLELMAS